MSVEIQWIEPLPYDDDTQKFVPLTLEVEVTMFHPVSKKRQRVIRYSPRYTEMVNKGWIELGGFKQ